MKRKDMGLIVFVLLAVFIAGCGNAAQTEIQTIPSETQNISAEIETVPAEIQSAQSENPESASAEVPEKTETADLTFADLSKRQFEFSSGAGAWSEGFTIEKDGYFKGLFNDSDMGVTGEGYEDGTRYSSSYTGHFTDLVKIDDYRYRMTLADISYQEQAGTEEIIDNIRYIYTGSYCLGGTDTFTVYLPGTPLGMLSEEIYQWIRWENRSETELSMVVIADETNGYGIYSYDRQPALENAQMTYNSYKASYDYYGEMLSSAATTAEMVEYSGMMYELSDKCLNEIWHLIRYNVEEEAYKDILTEQREWITEKEAAAEAAGKEYGDGSFAAVSYNDTLASLTIERCKELIAYLE